MPDALPLPHDLDAEGAVLAACLLDAGHLDELRDRLAPGDFYADANRRIWEAALALLDGGGAVDLVTVASELHARGRLEQVGGTPYLVRLTDGTPEVPHPEDYARVIADKALQRRLIAVSRRVAAEGHGDVGDVREWAQSVEQAIFDAAESAAVDRQGKLMAELVPEQIRQIGRRRDGVASTDASEVRFATIPLATVANKLGGGLRRGKVHVIAGRPGMGKSALALAYASGASAAGEGSVVVSVEMDEAEQTLRVIAAESKVSVTTLTSGECSAQDWVRISACADAVSKLPMVLCYEPGANVSRVRSVIRREIARLRRERHVDVTTVVVDYVQRIEPERKGRDANEASELDQISRRMMALAGELDVALVVVAQLNRDCEKRQNKRPTLSDLKGSGAFEQDAYTVQFVYRDEYYHEDSRDKGIAEIIIAKHRGGPTGTVRARFAGEHVRFDDYSEPDEWDGDFSGDDEQYFEDDPGFV